jgi:AcrR family transcriptional regulator
MPEMVLASRLSPAREQEILDTALELLAEGGFDALRMDAIALRARASKATLYRRWRSKGELVVDALRRRRSLTFPTERLVDTGTLRGDLLALVKVLVERIGSTEGRIMLGLVQGLNTDPELSAAWSWKDFDQNLSVGEAILSRARDRGELSPWINSEELRLITRSMLFGAAWMGGDPLDEGFAARIVDAWLLPHLRSAPAPAPKE